MNSAPIRFVAQFALPAGALLVGFVLLVQFSTVLLSPSVVQFYVYAAFAAGMLLALRFQSSRTVVALLLLAMATKGLELLSGGHGVAAVPGHAAFVLIAVLLPLNFIAVGFTRERGLTDARCAVWLAWLFVQSVGIAAASRIENAHFPILEQVFVSRALPLTRVPQLALLISVTAFVIIVARFVARPRTIESGLFWSLAAALLALHNGGTGRLASAYMATGALVLAVSLVETSYFMSYHDDLTGLRARRAFNQALLALDDGYSIAMVDVDHFKKFNDTFGHDTGDQVLRMVAAKLAQATGGGKAFRCGGEEFAVLFAGKSAKEAYAHAEGLRQSIEEATFVVRSPARVRRSEADRGRGRGEERVTGADRRKVSDRRRADRSLQGNLAKIEERRSNNGRRNQNEDRRSKSEGRRSRSRGSDGPEKTVEVFVTVSIGLAEASTRLMTPDMVLQAADKALYRAKDAGRNRVEIYHPMSRATRTREAASGHQEVESSLAPTEIR